MDDLGAASAATTWVCGGDGLAVTLTVEHAHRPLRQVEFRLYELLRDRLDVLLAEPEKMVEDDARVKIVMAQLVSAARSGDMHIGENNRRAIAEGIIDALGGAL